MNTNTQLLEQLLSGLEVVGGSIWENLGTIAFPIAVDGTLVTFHASEKKISKEGEEFDTTPQLHINKPDGTFGVIKLKDGVAPGLNKYYVAEFEAKKAWAEYNISVGDKRVYALDDATRSKFNLAIADLEG